MLSFSAISLTNGWCSYKSTRFFEAWDERLYVGDPNMTNISRILTEPPGPTRDKNDLSLVQIILFINVGWVVNIQPQLKRQTHTGISSQGTA